MTAAADHANKLPTKGIGKALTVGCIVALVTALASLFVSNRYTSRARLLPVDMKASSGLGQLSGLAESFGVNLPNRDNAEGSYIDILNSQWLSERILNQTFQYHVRSWMFGSPVLKRKTMMEYLGAKKVDAGVQALRTVITASRDMKTRLLVISAETDSPELSQQLVQATIRLLETFLQQKGRTRGSVRAEFAEARLAEAKENLIGIQEKFRAFLEGNRNYVVSSDPTVRLTGSRLEMEMKLAQQLVASLSLSREQALIEEKNDMPILNVIDGGNLPDVKSGPARSKWVAGMFIFSAAVAWIAINRRWILARIKASKWIDTQLSGLEPKEMS